MGSITEIGIHLADLVDNLADWSQETFGKDSERGPLGALKHLAKEAVEAQTAWMEAMARPLEGRVAPNGAKIGPPELHELFKTEMADCLILVIDAARRAGIKPMQLIEAAETKVKVNRSRKWPKPDEWVMEKPHFVDSEDCMGSPEKYWRVWAKRGDDQVCGHGLTPAQAIDDCRRNQQDRPVEHVRDA